MIIPVQFIAPQANFGSPAPGSPPHFFGAMIGRGMGIAPVIKATGFKGE